MALIVHCILGPNQSGTSQEFYLVFNCKKPGPSLLYGLVCLHKPNCAKTELDWDWSVVNWTVATLITVALRIVDMVQ